MLVCEGFKMFDGSALITPKNDRFPPRRIHGTWLYKPGEEYDCWYVNGSSYPAEVVSDIQEDKK